MPEIAEGFEDPTILLVGRVGLCVNYGIIRAMKTRHLFALAAFVAAATRFFGFKDFAK